MIEEKIFDEETSKQFLIELSRAQLDCLTHGSGFLVFLPDKEYPQYISHEKLSKMVLEKDMSK